MARYFRKMGCAYNVPPIFFLSPTLLKLKTPFEGVRYIYAEPEIDVDEW